MGEDKNSQRSGLEQAIGLAQKAKGAVKAGKAIANMLKGAATAGPAGVALEVANTFKKEILIIVVVVVIMPIKLIGNGKTVAHVKGEKNHTHPSYEITSHQHREWDFEAHREENGAYILEYHFLKRITYEKEYCGITHRAPEYMDVINAVNRQKGSVRYFCSRPPSPDWLPDGYVTFEEYPPPNEPDDYYPGEVTYDKPLASQQCDQHGLILDDKWAERRKAFASGLSQ